MNVATFAPIGGSEAAAACGLDPWKSQVRLYLEKRGEIELRDESEAATWGKLLQPIIAEEVERRGWQVIPAPAEAITDGYLSGHPDGYASAPLANFNDTRGVLEIKTAGLWRSKEWADDAIPAPYIIQCHHYMHLTGLEWALVAALIGGQRLELRVVERDRQLEAAMLSLEAEFWSCLTEGRLPAPDGSDATDEAIKRLYPEAVAGGVVNLTADDERNIVALKELKASLKQTEKQAGKIEQELKLRLGDNELGLLDGRPVVRWSNVHRKGYTVEEKDYRRFQVV